MNRDYFDAFSALLDDIQMHVLEVPGFAFYAECSNGTTLAVSDDEDDANQEPHRIANLVRARAANIKRGVSSFTGRQIMGAEQTRKAPHGLVPMADTQ